jgi:chromosomal replication initiation ATPase DnaA
MPRMTEEQLRRRDMKRDIGKELLQAIRQIKSGKAAQIHRFDGHGTAILGGRRKSRLSVHVENTTLEHFLAECSRTGKELRKLINEALADHAFNRRPVTASEARKIFRQELARSTQVPHVHRPEEMKPTQGRRE